MIKTAKRHREEFKEQIIILAKQGMNLSNIALELNLNRLDVKIVMQENNLYSVRKKNNKDNEELSKKAIQLYIDGYSLKEVEEKVDIPRKAISKILKDNEIELRQAGEYNQKYSVNHNAFSRYTPESAYWAGFIAGDGCVYSHGLANGNSTNNYLTVALQIKDANHLESFKSFLNYDGVLYYKNTGTAVSITVNSIQIVEDLKRLYNITNRKTYDYLPPKNIPSEMLKYFVLGLIDADGSFLRHIRTHKPVTRRLRGEYVYQIGFTGTYETCELVRDFFGSSVKIHTRHKHRDNNNYTVLFQGNEQVLKYGNKLYDACSSNFCMQRKYDNYCALREEYSEVACIGNDTWKQLVNS